MTNRLLHAATLGALLFTGVAQAQQPMPATPTPSLAPMQTNPPALRLGATDTRALQSALSRAGFDPGPADGVQGMRTRSAVMAWQRQNNMVPTGNPSEPMLNSLGVHQSAASMPRAAAPNRPAPTMGGAYQQAPNSGRVDAAGNPLGGVAASGSEGGGSNNQRAVTGSTLQGASVQQRDSAGQALSPDSPSGAPGSGSNNERVSSGTPLRSTGGVAPRDSAGRPLVTNSPSGSEGGGSNNAMPSGQPSR